jgi:hypothetical protein
MNSKIEQVKKISIRLFIIILVLIILLIVMYTIFKQFKIVGILPIAMAFGALGSFVSLQRRIKILPDLDLRLLVESNYYLSLAPISGAILAGILYILFISGLLSGELFPKFESPAYDLSEGINRLFYVTSNNPSDFAKLLFWSFVAGFSEKFVTDIVGRFEAKSGD